MRRRGWWIFAGVVGLSVGALSFVAYKNPKQARAWLRKLPGSAAGMAQPKTTARGMRVRWPRAPLTLTVDASVNAADPGAGEAVKAAAGAWLSSGAQLPDLAFDTATGQGPKQDGINGVYLAPITLPGHEKDVAITISYVEDGTGRLVEADVVLNAAYPFGVLAGDAPPPETPAPEEAPPPPSDPPPEPALEEPASEGASTATTITMKIQRAEGGACSGTYDVQTVAQHELGHFFGLGEDSANGNAVMFFKIKPCTTTKRALSADDVAVISKHYEGDGPAAPGAAPTDGGAGGCGAIAPGRANGAALTLAALGLLALSRRRSSAGGAA